MQPRDRQRIGKIKEYCEDIATAIRRYGDSFDAFLADRDFQHSVAFCILQIGELVGGLTDEFKAATSDRAQWQQIRGMRNLVAHNYGGVDLEIVWDVAAADIPKLLEFCADCIMSEEYSIRQTEL